jgi:hypothetical protein
LAPAIIRLSISVRDTADDDYVEDLTTKEEQPINTQNTIEELKSKLNSIETDESSVAMIPESQRGPTHHPPPAGLTEDGLIIPRKPPNPVKDNSERQNLHKELMFNQKIGKNVLNQKSELQRALEKQKENLAKKEMENHMATRTPELEKVIADRAKRLQANTNDDKVKAWRGWRGD